MINRVVLVGRLTKDIQVRHTQTNTATASFTLAVNRNFKNQDGSRDTDFINCVIWRKPAETLANYAHKGSLLGVEGRIQTRNYENQQGQRVYVTEVIVDGFSFLDTKNNAQVDNHQPSAANPYSQPTGREIDISDDQLPF